jgi:hypothetical protein
MSCRRCCAGRGRSKTAFHDACVVQVAPSGDVQAHTCVAQPTTALTTVAKKEPPGLAGGLYRQLSPAEVVCSVHCRTDGAKARGVRTVVQVGQTAQRISAGHASQVIHQHDACGAFRSRP